GWPCGARFKRAATATRRGLPGSGFQLSPRPARVGSSGPPAGSVDPGIHGAVAAALGVAGPPIARGFAHGALGVVPHLPPLPRSRGMTAWLVRKLLRDVRLALLIVGLLLAAFECLWAKVSERISGSLLPAFKEAGIPPLQLLKIVFEGPGKIIQTLI